MPFPVTPLLDSAIRSDENPLSDGGAWTAPTSDNVLKIISNRFAADSVTGASACGYRGSYLNPEVWVTINTYAGNHRLWLRLNDSGAQSPIRNAFKNGYAAIFNSSNFFAYVVTNSSPSLIAGPIDWATAGITWGNGIKIKARMVGKRLELFAKQDDSTQWAFLDGVNDTTYTAAGAIGLELDNTSSRLSFFGGGNITVPSTSLQIR